MPQLILTPTEQTKLKRVLQSFIKETDITIDDTGGEFYDGEVVDNLLCAHNILHKIDPTKHKQMTKEELDEKYLVV